MALGLNVRISHDYPTAGGGLGFSLLLATNILLAIQTAPASVAGTVRDEETGALLAGAVVLLVEADLRAIADAEGRYVLSDVPVGLQQLTVRHLGYAPRSLHLLIPPDGRIEINVALRADPVRLEAIEVRGAVAVRGLDSADFSTFPSRWISLRSIQSNPLLSEPDVLQAAGGGEVLLQPESPTGVHVRGGAPDQTAYLIDGVPVFSPYHVGGTFSAWNPDALAGLEVVTTATSPAFPDALAGTISARTRTPGTQTQTQGGVSTTQARFTVAGPIARSTGYLLSLRSTFPGLALHESDPSYVGGDGLDWLAKVAVPLFRGRFALLGYGNENDVGASAGKLQDSTGAQAAPTRNEFTWESRSLGAEWIRQLRDATLSIRAWNARGEAQVRWTTAETPSEVLQQHRNDLGASAVVAIPKGRSRTAVGVRHERSETSYQLRPASDAGDSLVLAAEIPVSAIFVEHARPLSARVDVSLSLASTYAANKNHLAPSGQLRWTARENLVVSAGYARRYQFAQSLRNPESVVGNVFPADLYIGAGSNGVPVAQSDLGTLGLEFRRRGNLRVGLHTYARGFQGVALVAPRDAGPYARQSVTVGTGNAYGLVLETALSGTRYGFVGSYGLQHVHLEFGDSTYVPDQGVTHALDAGFVVFPAASFSVRLGLSSRLGRRGTAIEGSFEWEACNLMDRGCEFSGSPSGRAEPLGATRLPAYHRIDLGVRKQWRVNLAGRQGELALFGTVTNLLGRKNVLTFTEDPSDGRRRPIEMRPLSPLVLGIDWRY